MLVTITKPQGIDLNISKYQAVLHAELVKKWNLTDTSVYKSYPRCFRNKKNNGYVAENFEGGKEYREVYLDDKLHASSFFGISDEFENESVNVHLVFFVDLKKLKPGITHRADEEVRNDVIEFAMREMFGFQFVNCELWTSNALKEYPGSAESLSVADMHPYHCFRINYKVSYSIYSC